MILPKCVIENGIKILQFSLGNLESKNNTLKESIESLEKKNKENIENLQNQNKILSNKIDNIIPAFTKFLPGINISELIKEINNQKNKLE